MKNKPLLSVVTINFNNEKGLARTLDSLFVTDIPFSIESIVIDGGSTDGSLSIINQHKSSITYWQTKPDKGIYDAMNTGLSKATGKYVWFLNSGDLVNHKETLALIYPFLQSDADIIYGETMMVDANYSDIALRSNFSGKKLPEELTYHSFYYGMSVGHQSIIVKTAIAPKYNIQWKHVADIDWVLNMLKPNPSTFKVDFVLSRFAVDGHSTQNRNRANKERYRLLKQHYGFFRNVYNHIVIALRAIEK